MGTLTGQTFKAEDAQTKRLIEEWKQFYPINFNNMHGLEPVVEVVLCEYDFVAKTPSSVAIFCRGTNGGACFGFVFSWRQSEVSIVLCISDRYRRLDG